MKSMSKCYNINLIIHFLQLNCHLFKSVHHREFEFQLSFCTWNRFGLTVWEAKEERKKKTNKKWYGEGKRGKRICEKRSLKEWNTI